MFSVPCLIVTCQITIIPYSFANILLYIYIYCVGCMFNCQLSCHVSFSLFIPNLILLFFFIFQCPLLRVMVNCLSSIYPFFIVPFKLSTIHFTVIVTVSVTVAVQTYILVTGCLSCLTVSRENWYSEITFIKFSIFLPIYQDIFFIGERYN